MTTNNTIIDNNVFTNIAGIGVYYSKLELSAIFIDIEYHSRVSWYQKVILKNGIKYWFQSLMSKIDSMWYRIRVLPFEHAKNDYGADKECVYLIPATFRFWEFFAACFL